MATGTLTYVTGVNAATNYVRVGHNSSAINNDAVWSFSLSEAGTNRFTSVTFKLTWNNSSAGTGWSGSYTYVFAVSSSGTAGRTAQSGTVLARTTVSLSGSSGTATVTISGLSLVPGTTYYLRANQNGSTYSTMKAFAKSGNTITGTTRSLLTYAISYNANGHGTAPSGQTKTYGTALTLQAFISNVNGSDTTVTITGNANGGTWSGSNGSAKWHYVYSQTHWNTNSGGTGTNYASKGSYTANAAATLYAIWSSSKAGSSYTLPTGTPTKAATTSSSMTVTFNANGGYTSKGSQTSVKTTTYTFKGWFTATSGGTQRTTSSRVTAAETVYAQYNSTTSAQAAVTLPTAAQCIRAGYTLLGFSTSSTATTATYQPGASYTPTASIILYAVWQKNSYTLTLGINSADAEYKVLPANPTLENWNKFRLDQNSFLAVHKDGYFDIGLNDIYVYNSASWAGYDTSSVITRVAKQTDNPFTNASYELEIDVRTPSRAPDWGAGAAPYAGWEHRTNSAANKVFIHLFVAKVPVGVNLQWAANNTGDDRTVEWLTSREGTGEYEVYAYQHNCGATGTFSTFGHVYIQTDLTTTQTIYLAYSEVFDVTAAQNQTFTVPYNTNIDDLPIPVRPGYKFMGWQKQFIGANKNYCNYGRDPMYSTFAIHMNLYMEDWSQMDNNARPISCTEGGGYSFHYTGSVWQFEIYDSTTSSYRYCTTDIDPKQLEGWHTIDITFDGTYIRFYLDGELNTTSPAYNAIQYAVYNSIFVGAEATNSQTTPIDGNYFTGHIGNVNIRNGTAVIDSDDFRKMTMPAQDWTLYAWWEKASICNVWKNNDWNLVPANIFDGSLWNELPVGVRKNNDWRS